MASWSNVILEDVHPLYGGCLIAITAGGDVWTVDVGPTMEARRFHGKLPAEASRDLDRLLASRPPRAVGPSLRPRAPDEARATLTFTATGTTSVSERWSNDPNEDFDAVARFLTDIARTFARNTSPIAQGQWRGGFVPRG